MSYVYVASIKEDTRANFLCEEVFGVEYQEDMFK